MFYFRINRLKIFDNRESRKILGLVGIDVAQVQIISFVTTDNTDLPNLDTFLNTNDATQREAILKEIVSGVVASRILTPVDNVKDNHIMTFGDTGYVLFQDNGMPTDFNWTFIAIDQRGRIRDTGQMINDVINDAGFSTFTGQLAQVLIGAANPTWTAAVGITKFITQVIATNLKNSRDREIGILYLSLNNREHYPHGLRNATDVHDLTANMLIDYSIFAYE